MVTPQITLIMRALKAWVEAESLPATGKMPIGFQEVTFYVNPQLGFNNYPALAIFCEQENFGDTPAGKFEARLQLVVYVNAADPEDGQADLQNQVHILRRALNRKGVRFAGAHMKADPIVNYNIIRPKDGSPIFRAALSFTARYGDFSTEEEPS